MPKSRTYWEYGVETRKAYNGFVPVIEWGGSYGTSHRYEYTADNVHSLASGNPVYRRLVTVYDTEYGEPELFERG